MAVDGPKESPGKWLVIHGTHRGTINDRETERYECDSEEAAPKAFAEAKQVYRRMGRVTWHANMYDDQGNRTVLEVGQHYRR